ncbi:Uncharacterized protein M6B38_220895 [Iris pallida]|uniref:Uncharacterized protein n=1 Tax=Iris pallida TaxID=29817 RepID=A0AAX6DYR8_IRIPA|nr:Uncharacterized protein M6B38_220895 [Iris pallida]
MTTTTSHHRYHSLGNIPFSWENSPGISKVAPRPRFDDDTPTAPCTYVDVVDVHHRKLSMIAKPIVAERPPPPPSTDDSRLAKHFSGGRSNLLIPLPPCMFRAPPPPPQQQPHRRSASRGYRPTPRKEDDPFLAAYRECTKSFNKDQKKGAAAAAKDRSKKGSGWLGFGFSCKQGSGVRDDSTVTVLSARNSGGLQIREAGLERSRSSGITGMAVGGHPRRKSMSI